MKAIVALAAGLACCLSAGLEAAQQKPPNILLIMADDLGFSDLGCYGGEISTPNLDALAMNGLRFTQFYNTARCWPTRAALLSGYYAQPIRRDRLPELGGGTQTSRPAWARLLPEFLKSSGYCCYHSGKWHIDGAVLKAGFDRSLNINNPGNLFTARGTAFDDVLRPPSEEESGYYVTTATADHAIRCLEEHFRTRPDSPFFQYVAFHAPHFPLHALPEDIARYQDRYAAGWDQLRLSRHRRQKQLGIVSCDLSPMERDLGPPYKDAGALEKLGPGEVTFALPWDELTEVQQKFQATKMAIHAAMVDRMDREIGRLIDQLKGARQFENTVILFLSDNGASSEIWVRDGGHDSSAAPGSARSYLCLGPGFSSACNTPFRRHKTWVHEGGISTPLIVHWPAGILARGQLRQTPAHVIDVVPTLLEVAGAEAGRAAHAPELPGRSLVPAFSEDVEIERPFLWWLHDGHRALRKGDWKLVATANGPWELYDLRTDRSEAHDLSKEYPDRVTELSGLWSGQTEAFCESVRRMLEEAPGSE